MNHFVVSLAWCWVQTLVVAGLAIGLSVLAMRRSPAAGAVIAWTGVLATLALTLVAPVPVPHWGQRLLSLHASENLRFRDSSAAADQETTPSAAPASAGEDAAAGFGLNPALLRNIAASVQSSQATVANHTEANRIVLGLFGLGVSLGLARIAYGLWAIAILCRRSRVIADERLAAVMNELRLKLDIRQLPQVRESSGLVSAAVVGWWRPTVLLPGEWREWSREELTAVLAHELAHVCRRDFALRLVAVFTSAVQCAQPLVYWLRWQLTLAQEMAADELAAAAVGSRAEYLQAITRLALRQESQPVEGSVGALLPVFSGFLLRRIAMLRAKDGRAGRGWRLPMQWSAIGAVIVAAVAATALRGLAEPPEKEADGSIRVATATAAKSKPAPTGAEAHAAAATLFQRPAFDLTQMPMRDYGGFAVRLGAILGQAGFQDTAKSLNESFIAGWKDAFSTTEAPAWSLQDIESITGDFRFHFKPLQGSEEKWHDPEKVQTNGVMAGLSFIYVRFQKPLNGQLESFRRVPEAMQKSHHEVNYVELPITSIIGPNKTCVCQIDDHTLLCAMDEKNLCSWLDKMKEAINPPLWKKAWNAVDGGLVTVVADYDYKQFIDRLGIGTPTDDEDKLIHDVLIHARRYSIGLDWQEKSDGVSVVKAQFRVDTEAEAGQMRNAMLALIDKSAEEVAAEKTKGESEKTEKDKKAEPAIKALMEALQHAKIETRQDDDGWLVEVQLAGPLDYRPLWES